MMINLQYQQQQQLQQQQLQHQQHLQQQQLQQQQHLQQQHLPAGGSVPPVSVSVSAVVTRVLMFLVKMMNKLQYQQIHLQQQLQHQ